MSRPDRRNGVALLSLLLAVLAGCAGPAASTPASPQATVAPPSVAASPTPAAAFPITVTDDEGTSVAIAAEPSTIVSLTPATTEILFALDAGDRVVAADDGSDYPEAAVALPDVATFSSVDVEKVVALEPDLVLAGGLGFTPAESISQLRGLDIPVIVVYATSVDGVYKDIELIGAATGTGAAATALTAEMRAEIDAISTAAAGAGTKPRVLYEVGYDDTTGAIYAPADASFLAEMVSLAGAETITTGDQNTYEMSLEDLIAKDPEIIVLGTNSFYAPTPEDVAKRTGWDAMTAVRNGDVRPVRDIEITRPGPRLPLGLRNLTSAIWPDLRLPAAG
jgi:iron complex transport system substrate-binding protein